METKEEKSSNFSDKIASFLVDSSSSKNKYLLYVLILTFIGFMLRLIAALNLNVLADDMLYASQSAGILSAKILSTHSNPPLFFYLTDLAYKVFGYTTFASRFWPLIFGTLLIPLIYLITKKFFNEKISVLAALFVTFSTFLIKLTYTEQSLVVLFFSMFGIYLGLEYIDKEKISLLSLSGAIFGLALLTKYSAPFFILSFLIFAPIYARSKNKRFYSKKNSKHLVLFFVVLLIFSSPFLVFNYLLYKDKGIVDVYFSRVVHLNSTQQLYGSLAGQENSFFKNVTTLPNYAIFWSLPMADLIIFTLGILGLLLFFMKKEKIAIKFLLITFLIPFIFQSAGAPLPKHFVFMPFLFSIPAAYALDYFTRKINRKNLIYFLLIVALIANLLIVSINFPSSYLTPSSNSQLKSYINHNVKSDGLVVFDPRIYTANTFWLATDKSFLNLGDFFTAYQNNLKSPSNKPIDIYFVECKIDDCGWGTIAQNQQLNLTSEYLFDNIRNYSEQKFSIYERKTTFGEEKEVYTVYKLKTMFDPAFIRQAPYLQNFYFTPYLYKNMKDYTFNYTIHNTFDNLLEKFSLWMIFVSIFFSIVSIFLIILLIEEKNYDRFTTFISEIIYEKRNDKF